jgi:hypothetical protein
MLRQCRRSQGAGITCTFQLRASYQIEICNEYRLIKSQNILMWRKRISVTLHMKHYQATSLWSLMMYLNYLFLVNYINWNRNKLVQGSDAPLLLHGKKGIFNETQKYLTCITFKEKDIHGLNEVLFWHLLGGTVQNHKKKTWVKIPGVPANIPIKHTPNTSLDQLPLESTCLALLIMYLARIHYVKRSNLLLRRKLPFFLSFMV